MIAQLATSPRGVYVLMKDGSLFERIADPRAFNLPTGRERAFIYRMLKNLPGRVVSIAQSQMSLFIATEDGRLFEEVANRDNPLGVTFGWQEVAPPPVAVSPESMV